MLWKDTLSLLDSSPIVILQENHNPDFLFVEHLDRYNRALADDTLYFATLSTLCKSLAPPGPQNRSQLSVMLLCDCEMPPEIVKLFGNIVCFRTITPFLNAFQLLQTSLRQSMRYNNRLQEFMELIAMEDDLTKLAEWLGDFFHHPVNIVDNSFTYLAHSGIEGFACFGSAELMKDVQNGYVSPEHIQKMQSTQGVSLFRQFSTTPILIYAPGEDFRQYHVPIPIGNTIAGAFSVYLHMDEDLDPLARLYLKKIARLISIVLQRVDFYSANKANFYSSFFSAMINGETSPSKLWETRLAAYGFHLLPCLYIIAAQFPEGVHKRAELQNLASTLHHIFPGSIYYIKDGLIILLCTADIGQFSVEYVQSQGGDFYARNGLKLGISSEFHSIYDIAIHYKEARRAIELGDRFAPNNRIFFYDNLRIFDVVCLLAQKSDIMSYCYPPFLKLLQYDHQNRTQLVHTLYFYLSNIKNPTAACRWLNIHKNTLYFRLDKIRSIMNVDFTKLEISTQIFLTIVILRYSGQISECELSPSEFLHSVDFEDEQ